jgi:hypothetical protein
MKRALLAAYGALLVVALSPGQLAGQRLEATTFRSADTVRSVAVPDSVPAPPRSQYMHRGAAVGGVIAGVLMAMQISWSRRDPVAPFVVVAAAVGGATIGGAVGWAVHLIRFGDR